MHTQNLTLLKNKINHAIKTLQTGGMVLIGDDGKRENEVDLIFHASHATQENVNFALSQAKGLLCVSISHDRADQLGFYTSPRFPGGCSHTNFTLSADAKHGITSGISAKDRAHTINLMANGHATFSDFITPGHVFPVRALDGGLLKRAGHTEASTDLCLLAGMSPVAVMCEILSSSGEPVTPEKIVEDPIFSQMPMISTAEILLYRLFFESNQDSTFQEKSDLFYVLQGGSLSPFLLPTAIRCYDPVFSAEKLRISMTDSFSHWDNGVPQHNACAEITLFSHEGLSEPLPENLDLYWDLSGKEGIEKTHISVRRVLSLKKAFEFLEKKYELAPFFERLKGIYLPVETDMVMFSHEIKKSFDNNIL